jgi:hypothetical protein
LIIYLKILLKKEISNKCKFLVRRILSLAAIGQELYSAQTWIINLYVVGPLMEVSLSGILQMLKSKNALKNMGMVLLKSHNLLSIN